MKKHYATQDFTDAGTGKSFKLGDHVDATEGEVGNYAAAGLATTDVPAAAAAKAPTPGA